MGNITKEVENDSDIKKTQYGGIPFKISDGNSSPLSSVPTNMGNIAKEVENDSDIKRNQNGGITDKISAWNSNPVSMLHHYGEHRQGGGEGRRYQEESQWGRVYGS